MSYNITVRNQINNVRKLLGKIVNYFSYNFLKHVSVLFVFLVLGLPRVSLTVVRPQTFIKKDDFSLVIN